MIEALLAGGANPDRDKSGATAAAGYFWGAEDSAATPKWEWRQRVQGPRVTSWGDC